MAVIDFRERQVTLKLVYYGPPRSGKTTNLIRLHERVAPHNRGRLVTLDTEADRTLFFDLLPIFFQHSNLSFRLKIYTVPGQPMHEVTRRLVLQKADGVCFVADSATSMVGANRDSFAGLGRNLGQLGLGFENVAVVTQFNKRDLDDRIPDDQLRPFASEEVVPATAVAGEGVIDTFVRLVGHSFANVDRTFGVSERFKISGSDFVEAVSQYLVRGQKDP